MQLKKRQIKFGLEICIGIALIYYIVHKEIIDFKVLYGVLHNPVNLGFALFFFTLTSFCGTARWRLLIKTQGLDISFKKLYSLLMIGNFFSIFMPGAVGGDVVRAWYLAGEEPKRRTSAIFTLVLDRLLGLTVIIYYSAITLLFYVDWLNGNLKIQLIAYLIWSFAALSLFFLVLFFTPAIWKSEKFNSFLRFLHRNHFIGKIIDSLVLCRFHRAAFLSAFLISAVAVFGMNIFFSILGESMGIPIGLAHYFFIVPLAITVSAIPIFPGGIGTGQVAFFTLFKWMGIVNPEQGGTLCTAYQVYTILYSCIGALFYLHFKYVTGVRAEIEC